MDDLTSETLRVLAAKPSATAGEVAHQVRSPLDEVREVLAILEEEGYVAQTTARATGGEPGYALTEAGYDALGDRGG